ARSVAAGARVIRGISTGATSAYSTGAAVTTSAAISSDAAKSTDTNSAVATGYRAEIQDFRVNDRRARSQPKALAAGAARSGAAISVTAVTAVTAVAAITSSSVAPLAASAARSSEATISADRRAAVTTRRCPAIPDIHLRDVGTSTEQNSVAATAARCAAAIRVTAVAAATAVAAVTSSSVAAIAA